MCIAKINEVKVPFVCRLECDFSQGQYPNYLDPGLMEGYMLLNLKQGWVLQSEYEELPGAKYSMVSYSSYIKDEMEVNLVINLEDDEVYFFSNNLSHLRNFINDYGFNAPITKNGKVKETI